MYCCICSFQDEVLLNYIETEGREGPECDYCGESETKVVRIQDLYDSYFKNLFKYYHKSEHGFDYHYDLHDPSSFGESLFVLVQEDWEIFNDEINDSLFFEIMSYGWDDEVEGNLNQNVFFSRITDAMNYIDGKDLWDLFSYNLINKNRFFPNEELDLFISKEDLLQEIKRVTKGYSYVLKKATKIYRARKGRFTKHDELEAPKKELLLKGGRANPAGIAMFYAALTEETAISEVRPYKGAEVTVATVSPIEDLMLVDLSHVKYIKSPFMYEDITHEVGSMNLLYGLQETLSKPIDPDKSEIDYVPSQYLTEYLKSLGYDGIVFKSSLGKANNLVIFDPSKILIEELNYFVVSEVEITFRGI